MSIGVGQTVVASQIGRRWQCQTVVLSVSSVSLDPSTGRWPLTVVGPHGGQNAAVVGGAAVVAHGVAEVGPRNRGVGGGRCRRRCGRGSRVQLPGMLMPLVSSRAGAARNRANASRCDAVAAVVELVVLVSVPDSGIR